MRLQDGEIKTATVLGYRKMDAIFKDMLPFKGERLPFPQTREQKKFVEDLVDWIVQRIDCSSPFNQVLNDPAIRLLFIPLDRHRRAFRQVVCSAGVVID